MGALQMLGYYPKAIDNYKHASIPEDVRKMHNDFIGSLNTKPSKTNCFYRRIYFSCRPEVDDSNPYCRLMTEPDCRSRGKKSIGHDRDVKIDYYPKYGIPFCYYPYWRQNPYHAPFVMAQFTNLQPGRGCGDVAQCCHSVDLFVAVHVHLRAVHERLVGVVEALADAHSNPGRQRHEGEEVEGGRKVLLKRTLSKPPLSYFCSVRFSCKSFARDCQSPRRSEE